MPLAHGRRPLVALALVLAACSSSGGDVLEAVGPAPTAPAAEEMRADGDVDAFYEVSLPLPAGEPGDVVRTMPIDGPPGTKAWRVLYRSESVGGDPIAVSGTVFVPDPVPDGPLPVLAIAHGTTGLADECAPSRMLEAEANSIEITDLPADIYGRYVVTATDYEGLGTEGVHPYGVNLSAGRSVLDAIRAAQRLPDIGTSAASEAVIWGHSQGGGAALVAAELAPTYAPDANVVGAAAGAPAAELRLLGSALRTSPYFGYIFMAGAGFAAAYPDIDLGAVFTPAGLDAVAKVAEQCATDAVDAYRGEDPDEYLAADPGSVEPFAGLLEENSPGVRSTDVPIFLYQGEADEQIPVVASKMVLDRYCANGTTAFRKTWPGADHGGVVPLALDDIIGFLEDRLAGEPPPTSC